VATWLSVGVAFAGIATSFVPPPNDRAQLPAALLALPLGKDLAARPVNCSDWLSRRSGQGPSTVGAVVNDPAATELGR